MENPNPPKALPEYFQESPPEYTEQPPTETTPTVATNPATRYPTYATGELVESPVRKVRKRMCVTTISASMAIAWTIVATYFSGVSVYWWLSSLPAMHLYEFLTAFLYPLSAAFVLALLLSPVFAVAGDVRCGNFPIMLKGVIPLNVFGLIALAVLYVAASLTEIVPILYLIVLAYALMFLAGGLFQANIIQFGRDVLGDANSPERSAFVHWYYWATYVPIFSLVLIYDPLVFGATSVLSYLVSLAAIGLLVFLLVTCIVHCVRVKSGEYVVQPRITENPVKLVSRVTRFALRGPASPGQRGFLARLNNTRQSKGGPTKDDDVDSVLAFWLVVLLMASLYGFFFWDDMWAMPLANGLVDSDSSLANLILSSQATTSIIVVVCVPIYQFVIRPFLGKRSPPHLWRIFAGLGLQLISLVIVIATSAIVTSKFGSEEVSNACNFHVNNDSVQSGENDGKGFGWYIFVVPQVVNGFSQLLVFPAVIDLILTDTPRVVQGLLIGIWYAMQSIHVIVSVAETATCAVFYWQYYIMKIVLVLVSIITFAIISSLYKRNHPMRNRQDTPTQARTVVSYQLLKEANDADQL